MKKLLILLALVGCKSQTRTNIEEAYPQLRCVKHNGEGYLCEDLDHKVYLCYSTDELHPNPVICFEGIVPPKPSAKETPTQTPACPACPSCTGVYIQPYDVLKVQNNLSDTSIYSFGSNDSSLK